MKTESKAMTAPECADGNVVYGASCYFFERDRTFTWLQAKEFCAGMKAGMWVPNCIDEWVRSNFLQKYSTLLECHSRSRDAHQEHMVGRACHRG
jgi:hypothetical protein